MKRRVLILAMTILLVLPTICNVYAEEKPQLNDVYKAYKEYLIEEKAKTFGLVDINGDGIPELIVNKGEINSYNFGRVTFWFDSWVVCEFYDSAETEYLLYHYKWENDSDWIVYKADVSKEYYILDEVITIFKEGTKYILTDESGSKKTISESEIETILNKYVPNRYLIKCDYENTAENREKYLSTQDQTKEPATETKEPGKLSRGEMLKELGIILGDDSGNLKEESLLTRAEMVTILNRMSKFEVEEFIAPDTATFSDIPKSHWAFVEVEKAYKNNITKGVGNGLFGVNDSVTYQQALAFLLRVLGVTCDYDKTLEVAKNELGLYLENVDANKKLTRAEIFTLMSDALLKETSDGKILVDKLIDYTPEAVENFKQQMNEK